MRCGIWRLSVDGRKRPEARGGSQMMTILLVIVSHPIHMMLLAVTVRSLLVTLVERLRSRERTERAPITPLAA